MTRQMSCFPRECRVCAQAAAHGGQAAENQVGFQTELGQSHDRCDLADNMTARLSKHALFDRCPLAPLKTLYRALKFYSSNSSSRFVGHPFCSAICDAERTVCVYWLHWHSDAVLHKDDHIGLRLVDGESPRIDHNHARSMARSAPFCVVQQPGLHALGCCLTRGMLVCGGSSTERRHSARRRTRLCSVR
ncbi:hypothetical protein BD413DRAFT_558182 [Trametes elegans]|nr:hypothetical protein BD413DRAFT_558182 [Trametes elegans]